MARLIRKPPPRRQLGGGEGYAAWIGQHRSAISQVATAAAFDKLSEIVMQVQKRRAA